MKSKKFLLTVGKKPGLGTTAFHYGDLRPSIGLGFLAAFLEQQKDFLIENKGEICEEELADYRFPTMPKT